MSGEKAAFVLNTRTPHLPSAIDALNLGGKNLKEARFYHLCVAPLVNERKPLEKVYRELIKDEFIISGDLISTDADLVTLMMDANNTHLLEMHLNKRSRSGRWSLKSADGFGRYTLGMSSDQQKSYQATALSSMRIAVGSWRDKYGDERGDFYAVNFRIYEFDRAQLEFDKPIPGVIDGLVHWRTVR